MLSNNVLIKQKSCFSGDKPHECEVCGKKFALQCNLRTHMKTHDRKYSNKHVNATDVFYQPNSHLINILNILL